MIAPWVLGFGLYCWELGCWLQRWSEEQRQALQQPNSSISCNGTDADATLQLFSDFASTVQLDLGSIRLQQVESLWESGSDLPDWHDVDCTFPTDSIEPAAIEKGGLQAAECVAKWQQWQQSAAAGSHQQQQKWQQSAAGQQQQQWQQSAAGVQAYAATPATGQPSASVLTAEQQQVQVPVYGSLEHEFSTLFDVCAAVWEVLDSMVRNTQQHIRHLMGSSSSGSECSGRDEPFSDGDDCACERDQVVAAAKQKVKEASTIQGSMQACLEYPSFARIAMELQEVGEAIFAKVPVPYMCNNPRCTCLDGTSELQLVGGKACVCGRCRVAR
jgi:hypothetical protein